MQQQPRTSIPSRRLIVLILLVGCLFAIGLVQPVYATDFRGSDTITIPDSEVIDDDLFISGETVTVNGTVKGNLFASGSTVTINGHVEGSLFIAGRTLVQNGVVDGSAYVGGYAFTLGESAAIGRNLNFGGFSLTTEAGSTVGRSLYGGGYQLLLNGQIDQDVNIGAGALEVTGVIGGDLRGSVGSSTEETPTVFMPQFEEAVPPVPPGLRISPEARIGGDLAVETQAVAVENAPPFFSLQNTQLRWAIGEFLALLLVGILLLYMRPSLLQRAGAAVEARWLPSLGVGSLTLAIAVIVAPLLLGIIVLLAIFGGWVTLGHLIGDIVGLGVATLAFLAALFWFVAAMITKIVVAYTGGNWIMRTLTPTSESSTGLALIGLALGLFIYIALRMIPFGVGAVIGLLVTVLGLGALYFGVRGGPQPQVVGASRSTVQMTEVHA
ncbi:MAG: hypothetical protein R3E79_39505 [Caldilineaceae bacterium]